MELLPCSNVLLALTAIPHFSLFKLFHLTVLLNALCDSDGLLAHSCPCSFKCVFVFFSVFPTCLVEAPFAEIIGPMKINSSIWADSVSDEFTFFWVRGRCKGKEAASTRVIRPVEHAQLAGGRIRRLFVRICRLAFKSHRNLSHDQDLRCSKTFDWSSMEIIIRKKHKILVGTSTFAGRFGAISGRRWPRMSFGSSFQGVCQQRELASELLTEIINRHIAWYSQTQRKGESDII